MEPWTRLAIPVASVAVLVVLFLLLRPGDDSPDGVSPTTPTTTSPTSSASVSVSVSASPTPSPVPDRTVIEVTYRDGAVQGPTSFTVTQGDRVRLLVRADVSDEVHFHGYDLSADVTPQDPATIDFVANAAGVYEVELEGAGEPLFELKIVP
jgi:FtsP/CotA-like multicopper oxidase with cupredoxin domain